MGGLVVIALVLPLSMMLRMYSCTHQKSSFAVTHIVGAVGGPVGQDIKKERIKHLL